MDSKPLEKGDLVSLRQGFTCLSSGRDVRLRKGLLVVFLEEFEHPATKTPWSVCLTESGECIQIPGVGSKNLGTKVKDDK